MYDLAFASGVHVFASVGADGSVRTARPCAEAARSSRAQLAPAVWQVRMFDLRSLEHSTIIYESADGQGGSPVPLIRLAWNKQDPNYLATITMDSNTVVILDIRVIVILRVSTGRVVIISVCASIVLLRACIVVIIVRISAGVVLIRGRVVVACVSTGRVVVVVVTCTAGIILNLRGVIILGIPACCVVIVLS